jgi:alanyl-tRNA synthetase
VRQALQAAVKTLSTRSKPIFVFASTSEAVQYSNILPKAQVTPSFTAKTWSAPVAELLGGKSGGKDEGTTGSGSQVAKIDEAVALAEKLATESLGKP